MLTSCNNIKKTLMTTAEATAVPIDITKDKDCPEEYHPGYWSWAPPPLPQRRGS
jgi:hypothetical protein